MSQPPISPVEKLRTIEALVFPDPREQGFGGGIADQSCLSTDNQAYLEKRIQIIDQYKLVDAASEKVQVQFETAKNLLMEGLGAARST